MDDVTWAALTATLTLLGGLYTWLAFRRRGPAAGLRGAGFTLLPLAAYLTDTLQMFTRIVDAVGDWAVHLVFSPVVWLGAALAGVSAVLLVVSGMLRDRELGAAHEPRATGRGASKDTPQLPASSRAKGREDRGAPAIDDDLAEIEALLRKRGIS